MPRTPLTTTVRSSRVPNPAKPAPQPAGMHITIAGTGPLAHTLATALSAAGHTLTLLSRHPPPPTPAFPTTRVSYTHPASLAAALTTTTLLISTIPATAPQLALIDACLTSRVPRFLPAEFHAHPHHRPLTPPRPHHDPLAVLSRLREERHRLRSVALCCGLRTERLLPDAPPHMRFLLDLRERRVELLPVPADAWVCLTTMRDLAAFVVAVVGMREWPEVLRVFSVRVRLREVLEAAAEVVGGLEVRRSVRCEELLEMGLEEEGEEGGRAGVETLVAVVRGEFDLGVCDLPEVPVCGLREWLGERWREEEG